MSTLMLDDIDAILRLVALPKRAHNWSGFQPRGNHAGSVIGNAYLTDENDVFIVGTMLEIEIKAPIIAPRCLMLFTIMQRKGTIPRQRVFQLEVCPHDKRSHNGVTTIYGPHLHIGDDEPSAVSESGVNCEDWERSLQWFLRRINVQPFIIDKPC
jgi:hypothetical protein